MSKAKILLVEDDPNFGDVLYSYLQLHDYEVTWKQDGEAGLKAYKPDSFDLGVFDVMMPKMDGFSLAGKIRERDGDLPIIFLTAKAMKEDVIQGFKIGADDYVTKPFNSEELLYRIEALLKRTQQNNDKLNSNEVHFEIGKYHFNYPLRVLSIPGHEDRKLSPKEAELLRLFCLYRNDVLPRNIALTKIWREDNYFTARSMDVFVTKLRKYLGDDTRIQIINIHGNGFQLRIEE